MAVRGMDDVHVTPFQRPTRRCQLDLRVSAPFMDVAVPVGMVVPRTGPRYQCCKRECKQRREPVHCERCEARRRVAVESALIRCDGASEPRGCRIAPGCGERRRHSLPERLPGWLTRFAHLHISRTSMRSVSRTIFSSVGALSPGLLH